MKDFSGIIVNSAGNESTHIDNDESVIFPVGFARSFEVNEERYDALENLIVVGSENSE